MAVINESDNDCVGCETCINCGRGRYTRTIVVCDDCDAQIDRDVYEYNGNQFCKKCLIKAIFTEQHEDMMDFLVEEIDHVADVFGIEVNDAERYETN